MPLIIQGRVPTRWEERQSSRTIGKCAGRAGSVSIALINNMPDAALEDTEMQFFELLDAASGDVPVYLKLYALPGIPRTERGSQHVNSFYFDFGDLWQSRVDGVIITGTEPRQPNLQDEAYWGQLAELFDWVQSRTNSTVLSCLAAHASVLHFDGIHRHPLADKRFGVFESTTTFNHALTMHSTGALRFPHSRWNEVRENELISAGYTVLTKSADVGVDLFVKKTRKSLLVHFQGHPEYGAHTLLKEYRRDIKRYLRAERENYPPMPLGYFDSAATQLLSQFQERAMAERAEENMAAFPESVAECLQNGWHSSAAGVYRNWLQYLLSKQADTDLFATVPSEYTDGPARRSLAR